MTDQELNRKVAELRGLSVYHYDKDIAKNCYFVLLDSDLNAVVPFDREAGIRTGYRATEVEAWADAPNYCADPAAWGGLFVELAGEGYCPVISAGTQKRIVYAAIYTPESAHTGSDPSPGRALALAYVASQEGR